MKTIILCLCFMSFSALASIVGISTHPLNREARVLSAEMTGYMNLRQEMGMGLRYTQEVARHQLFDLTAGGGQDSRSLTLGGGMDYELLSESLYQPRVAIKPYFQYQKIDDQRSSLLGFAPSLRKGLVINGMELFPYLAVPTGVRIDTATMEFVYYASLTMGASMPFPGLGNNKFLLSLEGNKNMGASSDYVGCLVSWIWK
jgi:hypothetical protein